MDLRGNQKIFLLIFSGVFMGFLDIGIVGLGLPYFKYTSGCNESMLSWVFIKLIYLKIK